MKSDSKNNLQKNTKNNCSKNLQSSSCTSKKKLSASMKQPLSVGNIPRKSELSSEPSKVFHSNKIKNQTKGSKIKTATSNKLLVSDTKKTSENKSKSSITLRDTNRSLQSKVTTNYKTCEIKKNNNLVFTKKTNNLNKTIQKRNFALQTNFAQNNQRKKPSKTTVNLINNKLIYDQKKYEELKEIVRRAIKQKKVFIIYGRCTAVRRALKNRGWVEKLTRQQFDHLRQELTIHKDTRFSEDKARTLVVNHLLARENPNFLWLVTASLKMISNDILHTYPLLNRINIDDKHFTTKEGLCSALKFQHWFHINGISDIYSPRSYNIYDESELAEYKSDYKITACTCLLQWFIKQYNNKNPNYISNTGNIFFSVIYFALKRCQTYIQCKQHRDIDKIITEPKPNEWDTYIDSYFRLVSGQAKLRKEHHNVITFYVECSSQVLQYMKTFHPELECEGFNNIWIIKPAHWSRGRGITLANDLKKIINVCTKQKVQKYVVQKYIELPLLIYNTKFDIRQYYILTNTHPLKIWMYKTCYLKFSSQTYSLKNFHESIHLTNNAIQHKYDNCPRRHGGLPKNNMWSLEQFKDYLKMSGISNVWDDIIYPGMKKNIIGAMLSCQDGMVYRHNQYEMYGCDFILDAKYRPWLIEINSCPDMSGSTSVTAKLCPQALEDIIKVVVDHKRNSCEQTGYFECIYKQKMTNPVYTTDMSSLTIQGREDKNIVSRVMNHKPQYKEATTDEASRIHLPWKKDIITLQSEEDFLKHTLMKMQSEETLVHQYTNGDSLYSNDCSNTKINVQSNDSLTADNSQQVSLDKYISLPTILETSTESNENDMNLENTEEKNTSVNTSISVSNLIELLISKEQYLTKPNVTYKLRKKYIINIFIKDFKIKYDLHKTLPFKKKSKQFNLSGFYSLKKNPFKRSNSKFHIILKHFFHEQRLPKNPVIFRSNFFKNFTEKRMLVHKYKSIK